MAANQPVYTEVTNLSVTISKNQAGPTDRGRPMSAKLSSFVLYPIRLQLLVFIPKYNLLPAILTTPLLLALFLRAERVKFGYIERQNFRTKNRFSLDCWNVSVYCAFEQLISTVSTNRDEKSRTGIVSNIANLCLARLHTISPIF